MKSAYELAMERLKADDNEDSQPLSEEQKQELAEIDKRFEARLAEREVLLQKELSEAADNQTREEAQAQWVKQRAGILEDRELAKEKVRRG